MKTSTTSDISSAIWIAADKKGCYTMLERPVKAYLRQTLGELAVDEDFDDFKYADFTGPFRAPEMRYEFVEICGGAGVVSKAAAQLGMVVAPPLDISDSPHYDLRDVRFLEWIIFMISENRFESFLVEPPCTSFSAACHPAVRSYDQPLGFDRREPRTLHGNILAFRSFVLLAVGLRLSDLVGLSSHGCQRWHGPVFGRDSYPLALARASFQHVSLVLYIGRTFVFYCICLMTCQQNAKVGIIM